MQEENVAFLKNNIKYLGFDEKVGEEMVAQIKEGNPAFYLEASNTYHNKTVDYKLQFRQSTETGRYFFNRYEAQLGEGSENAGRKQLFYVEKGRGVTAKEAFNLLEGRYVHKSLVNKAGKSYDAHMRLDFGSTDERGYHKTVSYTAAYGYKLEETLAKVPIKEMLDPEVREQLIRSLDRGNLQMVTIDTGEHLGRYYITPDPVKGLNMFDEKLNAVDPKDLGLNLRFKRNVAEAEKTTVEQKGETKLQSQKQAETPTEKQEKKQRIKMS